MSKREQMIKILIEFNSIEMTFNKAVHRAADQIEALYKLPSEGIELPCRVHYLYIEDRRVEYIADKNEDGLSTEQLQAIVENLNQEK